MKTVKEEFFKRKKDKAFFKLLKKFVRGYDMADIEIAKCLSSMLTHSLIDMQGIGTPIYRAMDIEFQAKCLAEFLGGEVSVEELRQRYIEKFSKYIK